MKNLNKIDEDMNRLVLELEQCHRETCLKRIEIAGAREWINHVISNDKSNTEANKNIPLHQRRLYALMTDLSALEWRENVLESKLEKAKPTFEILAVYRKAKKYLKTRDYLLDKLSAATRSIEKLQLEIDALTNGELKDLNDFLKTTQVMKLLFELANDKHLENICLKTFLEGRIEHGNFDGNKAFAKNEVKAMTENKPLLHTKEPAKALDDMTTLLNTMRFIGHSLTLIGMN